MSRKHKSSTPQTLVDIVIPVYRRFDMLEKCLASIPGACEHNQGHVSCNVILVDNGSPQEEADAFYKDLPHTIIRNKENLGFPTACNQGARRKSSRYIFFLNSDVVLYPGSIYNLVQTMEASEDIGVAGMKLLFPKGTPHGVPGMVQHVGLWSDIHGRFQHAFINWNPEHPKVKAMRTVLAVTGAALMTRRSMWNLVGGFEEAYGRGVFEDVDYCLKIASAGKAIIVEQEAVGEHYVGATATAYNLSYNLTKNEMIFMARWASAYPWTQVVHV